MWFKRHDLGKLSGVVPIHSFTSITDLLGYRQREAGQKDTKWAGERE